MNHRILLLSTAILLGACTLGDSANQNPGGDGGSSDIATPSDTFDSADGADASVLDTTDTNNARETDTATSDTTETISGSDSADSDTSNQIDTNGGAIALGQWAEKTALYQISEVPVVGDVKTSTFAVNLVEISKNGGQYVLTRRACDIKIEEKTDSVDTIIPDAFVDALPEETSVITIESTSDGLSFRQPKLYRVIGADMDNIRQGNLPESPDDPRVIDHEEDGNPGATVRISGLVSGEIYLVQRSWQVLEGSTAGPDRITGTIQGTVEQSVLDAEKQALKNQPPRKDNPERQNRFELVKVDEDATCQNLVQRSEQLFESFD